jgi:uncharacterized repeat protein (TIGR01451 family)
LAALAAAGTAPARGQGTGPLELVQKLADQVSAGVPVLIEISLRNVSKVPVEGIRVSDDLPAGFDVREAVPPAERSQGRLSWLVTRLGPGEERRFRLTLQARPETRVKSLRNLVDVAYTARLSSTRVARVAGPDLLLEAVAPQRTPVGAATTLLATIRNHGDAAARNVSLQAVLPAGLSHPQGADLETIVGTLEPGAEQTVPLRVTPSRGGEFKVRLSVQADGTGPIAREIRLVADEPHLVATAGGPTVLPQQLTGLFEVTVRNDGSGPCPAGVTVLLPEGLDFVRASEGGQYDRQAHSVRWDLGELRPAERRVLAWNGSPRTAGEMACRVRLTSRERLLQECSWKVRVAPGGGAAN